MKETELAGKPGNWRPKTTRQKATKNAMDKALMTARSFSTRSSDIYLRGEKDKRD